MELNFLHNTARHSPFLITTAGPAHSFEMDEFGDLDGSNLNDIIRNALSLALEQDTEDVVVPAQPDVSQVQVQEEEQEHQLHNPDENAEDNLQIDEAALLQSLQAAGSMENDEYEANRQLLEQLQAVINQDDDLQDDDQQTAEIQASLESALSEIVAEPEVPAKKPEKELSIAETLALSRSRMKRPANSDKLVDPMLARYGIEHRSELGRTITKRPVPVSRPSYSPQPSQNTSVPHVQRSTAILASTHPPDTALVSSTSSSALSSPVVATTADNPNTDSNDVMRALMMAKRAIDEENSQDLVDNEAMDAVHAVLQALGKSFNNDTDPSVGMSSSSHNFGTNSHSLLSGSSDRPPEKKRRRRVPNSELTEEEKERIRIENRLRKKKWRGINSDRNKDNDLRARLHRRAVQKFGAGDSPEKAAWIDEEFQKRREKRLQRDMNTNKYQTFSHGHGNTLNQPSSGDDVDLSAALETLNESGHLDLNSAVNSLVKDPSILKTMIDFLSDNSIKPGQDSTSREPEQGSSSALTNSEKPSSASYAGHLAVYNTTSPKPPPYLSAQTQESRKSSVASESNSHNHSNVEEDSRIKSLGFPPMIGLRQSPHSRA